MGRFQRRKTGSSKQLRVAMRLGTLLVGGLFLFGTTFYFSGWQLGNDVEHPRDIPGTSQYIDEWHRNLQTDDSSKVCDDEQDDEPSICTGNDKACKQLEHKWLLIFVILGLLYLFVGIAIVCDELFVPALEIIAEDLELSNDVAGATLMAAGGSAPELATSFVGTFKRSDVGFGTIVGSAVFNVLFVIGMCVMFTPEKYAPLELTWWPLFRDCSYYVVTLAFLAYFMSDQKIEWWEALIQLFLYFGYVFMMSKSEKLEKWLTSKFMNKDSEVTPASDDALEKKDLDSAIETGEKKVVEEEASTSAGASFVKPSTFRVGILQLLTSKQTITETAGVAFVAQIKGDVNVVFNRIDTNQNGQIDKNELKTCLQELGTPEEQLTDEKINEVMSSIDKNQNGYANKADFTLWYLGNEQRLKNKTREIFDKYDKDKKNTISRDDVHEFMVEIGHNSADVKLAIEDAISKIQTSSGDTNMLTYDDFTNWYFDSSFWDQEKNAAEQAVESQDSMYEGLISGWEELFDAEHPLSAKVTYIITLPLTLLFCLIPDCRPPGMEGWAKATLLASIIMIALFAIVMVELAEMFGATIGIPDVVMGLTILAAGTSVPDLLSSVIVAQQGQGDMAVSSSIGSNIFDVAFGLPLPWLCYSLVIAVNNCSCEVGIVAENLFESLITLLVMVAAIVAVIHFSNWRMTHYLGYAMFLLYFLYLAFALLRTPAKDYKVEEKCDFNLGY